MALVLAALGVAAFEPGPAEAQGFGFGRRFFAWFRAPPAREIEKPDENDAQEQRSLVLPDNGDQRRKLDLVRRQAENRHFADAARQLGQMLQDAELRDFFTSRDDDRSGGLAFRAQIRRLLHELPPEGRAAYGVQFEALARTRLNAALARGDESSLREAALRFPETRAGDEALFRLGHFLWDHGRAHDAKACFERLRLYPESAGPFEPSLSVMISACQVRLGNREEARAALAPLRDAFPEAVMPIADISLSHLMTDDGWNAFVAKIGIAGSAQAPRLGGWQTYRGNAQRNGQVAARAPILAPRWSRPASSHAQTQLSIGEAWRSYCEGVGTSLPLLHPLAVGDLVLARTPRGVAAFDLESGACRWRHPADDDDGASGLDRILWQEPIGGAFAADDECVYLVDEARLGDSESLAGSENVLSACEHFHSREGNLRWQVGGADGGADSRLAGAFFLGPPLAWHGRLYLLAELKQALALIVIDRSNGQVAWSQELAQVERNISGDLSRLMGGAAPSISSGGVIVCPTSGGAVVAVDSTTQSLLWAYRYARKPPGQPIAAFEEIEPAARLDQFDRWLDGTASIGEGCVVVSPADSPQIHCLDLHDGGPKWMESRGDGMFVAAISTGQVLVVDRRQIRALRLEDGKAAWSRALPAGSFPAGRGVFTGERYYLPVTTAAILEVDAATGAVLGEHKSPRELTAGNLIWHKGIFISQGPLALEAFDERDRLAEEVRERLDRNPRDAEALLRLGDLELDAGRAPAAIAAFRKAHETARSAKTKSRLVSALLDGIRRKLPDSDKLSEELDLLAEP